MQITDSQCVQSPCSVAMLEQLVALQETSAGPLPLLRWHYCHMFAKTFCTSASHMHHPL